MHHITQVFFLIIQLKQIALKHHKSLSIIFKSRVLFSPHYSHVGTGDTSDCTTITIPVPEHNVLGSGRILRTCRQPQQQPSVHQQLRHCADSKKHYLKVPQIMYGHGSRSGSRDHQRKCGFCLRQIQTHRLDTV